LQVFLLIAFSLILTRIGRSESAGALRPRGGPSPARTGLVIEST
jgi:hypothetical protein